MKYRSEDTKIGKENLHGVLAAKAMIHLWPFANGILRVKLWLMERRMVFNRAWNKEARQIKQGGK